MILTVEAVDDLLKECFFEEGEDISQAILAKGVLTGVGFHPERLANCKERIIELLNELPSKFHEGSGGGTSFLCACEDKNGNHWGEHPDVEGLLLLGLAIKRVKFIFPRELWPALPGSVPYFCVLGRDATDEEIEEITLSDFTDTNNTLSEEERETLMKRYKSSEEGDSHNIEEFPESEDDA